MTRINPNQVANKAVSQALDNGVSVQTLRQNGVALLTKQLQMDGILPPGMSQQQLDQVRMALALAIEQLAANTQPADVTGGVTA
ncbi:MAG: hypothetical protein AB2A00_06815 [Myxococcota bacterium]